MSSVSASFFTPQTVSVLFCLYELNKQMEEVDASNKILKFLINKILQITNHSSTVDSNELFEAQMLSITGDDSFLERYQQTLSEIGCFNDFYRQISSILKNLRGMRNSKLQQSNLIDFLVRRLYIYFQKLDFKEIITIYDNFMAYLRGLPKKLKQHEFMLTKTIEEVKFNMENYPLSKDIDKLINQLERQDHTFKTSYLKGLMKAQEGIPSESIHSIHRYFDKSLGNLFQEKIQSIGSSNKINHCILSIAYASLKMGHLDQCLQSISEGLRISQNNSDEESINNCIIYLYKIAQRLGKFRQQILLAEHAITHSLNQNNLMLMLYSCLNYSYFEKNYNCKDSSLAILKTRQINWTDALHFAKKKIYSHFQNNCKNIFHTHRNLLIPTFVHKIAILIHIPCLKNLLLNSYYQRQELMELNIYKEYQEDDQISALLRKTKLYLNMGQKKLLQISLAQLKRKESSPKSHIKIATFENQVILRSGNLSHSYEKAQELLQYCTLHGYTKHQYALQMMLICKILIQNQLFYDALLKCQECLELCETYRLKIDKMGCLVMKAQILLKLDETIEAMNILKEIEEMGETTTIDNDGLVYLYEIKMLLNEKLKTILEGQKQREILNGNALDCFRKIINLLRVDCNLVEMVKWFRKWDQKYIRAITYGEKVLSIMENSELETSDDVKIAKKVMVKMMQLADFV